MNWILAGITFGFLGSFHCIGMCGPLALALPGTAEWSNTWRHLYSRLTYNLGRVVTYSLLGAGVGLASRMISLGGYQQGLSIAVGTLILLGVAFPPVRRKLGRWKGYPAKLIGKAVRPIKSLFKHERLINLFLIGILNGFLPCGFVYMALAAAITSGSVFDSLYFMTGFGFGTIPAMLGVSLAGGLASVSLRQKLQKWSPYLIALVGFLLILRGLNLGIPFLSPEL